MKTIAEINQSPFYQGYRAYNERKGPSDNPYPEQSDAYEKWYDGWCQADREAQS